MTVCIAVACECYAKEKAPQLVLVSDRLFSLGNSYSAGITSMDTGLKLQYISDSWFAMYAGDDISFAHPVIDGAATRITEGNETTAAIQSAMVESYKELRKRQIQDTYLGAFGWTMEEFSQRGNNLGAFFQTLLYEIREFNLGCEFLLCGFPREDSKEPEMFYIQHPGVAKPISQSLSYADLTEILYQAH